MKSYTYHGWRTGMNREIIAHLKEGCGIRSIARLLEISPTTVQKRILIIARKIQKPSLSFGKDYEVDELCTFIGTKQHKRWIAYALRRDSGQVADFRIGTRSNRTLQPLIETLTLSDARRIYTDGLANYRTLIHPFTHRVKRFGTNRIERMNLTLRTHLKRLARRAICFSRSWTMLHACLKIYFWSRAVAQL